VSKNIAHYAGNFAQTNVKKKIKLTADSIEIIQFTVRDLQWSES